MHYFFARTHCALFFENKTVYGFGKRATRDTKGSSCKPEVVARVLSDSFLKAWSLTENSKSVLSL